MAKTLNEKYQDAIIEIQVILGVEVELLMVDLSNRGAKFPSKYYSLWTKRTENNDPRTIRTISSWYLSMMPGCCGIAISHDAYVYENFRGKGIGKILNLLRQRIAKDDGYTQMLCTHTSDNAPQNKILAANNWKELTSFVNKRTGNEVVLSVNNLL